ncbi:thiol reductant ABC exporter subunit CydD [Angustibacter luteus]|uniref:Thiol reductant ABC exporter subunit CydD n=1 Tax=Angustibacter luteus TaxID=658456 RepID=A0ABW1JD64_9ACTN
MPALDPRLLRQVAPARRYVALTAAVGVTTGALVVAQALLLADVVAAVFYGADVGAKRAQVGALAVVVLLRAVLAWVQERYGERAATQVVAQLRQDVLRHGASLGAGGLTSSGRTALVALVTDGLERLQPYLSRYLPQLVAAAVLTPALLAVVLWQDPLSALVIAVTLPLVPLFMALVGLMTRDASARRLVTMQRLGSQVLDLLVGLPTLVALGRERGPAARVRRLGQAHRHATNATLRTAFLSSLVLELLTTLSVALVAVEVGLRLLHGNLGLRTALVVLVLAPEVYLPLRQVGTHFHASTDGLAAADAAFAALGQPLPADGTLDAPDLRTAIIELRDVVVRHEGRDESAPDGLTLTLRPGTVVAMTGPSGSGKTTAAQVVLRLRTIDDGVAEVVDVDGLRTPLSQLVARTWWDQLCWLDQDPVLVPGTLRHNALLFERRSDAHAVDEDRLAAAAVAAGFEPVVADVAGGWDARVGRDGLGLSAGQRQRLALVRVLLADAQLVVLDEPTAHLDGVTQDVVIAALDLLRRQGRTVLVVSHRESLAAHADVVVSSLTFAAPEGAR